MADPRRADAAVPRSFSPGVDALLGLIRPHGRPETVFPDTLDPDDARRSSGEHLHAWFVRLIDRYCDGDPSSITVEDNIAVIAHCGWEGNLLTYASMPVIVTHGCTLEEYYISPHGGATYLRFDLNRQTLGPAFSHPLPHIHVGDEGSPRFALDGGASGNVVMDFLELVYRNYAHTAWIAWAKRQWLSEITDERRNDLFDAIAQAFGDGDFDVLRAHADTVHQIKSTLRAAKDSMFKAHMKVADRELLEYPAAS